MTEFRRNPIALLNHDPDRPIGKWANLRIENGKLMGHLEMAPEGTSPRIDEIIKLIRARILCSCSVGFLPIESEPRAGSKGGIRYKKQRLVECSIVAIPANANAMLLDAKKVEAQHLGLKAASINQIFQPNKNGSLAERQHYAKLSIQRSSAAELDERIALQRAYAEQWKYTDPAKAATHAKAAASLARAKEVLMRSDARMAREAKAAAPSLSLAERQARVKTIKADARASKLARLRAAIPPMVPELRQPCTLAEAKDWDRRMAARKAAVRAYADEFLKDRTPEQIAAREIWRYEHSNDFWFDQELHDMGLLD